MTQTEASYALRKVVQMNVAEAEAKVREELAKEGFGVLTEIDMAGTLKKKLDVDVRPYRILGACNPPLAYRALQEQPDIGLLLPCNVVVYEGEETGTSVVSAIDPVVQMSVADHPGLAAVARDVRTRLGRVMDALS